MDLETIPNLHEALKVWPQLSAYPGQNMKATITSIGCFGYQEFGVDKSAKCISAWDFPEWKKDVNNDKALLIEARKVLADADALITHNGKRFDLKFFNTRLLVNGLEALDKLKHIDTCQKAKSHLYLFNNRLDTLGTHLVGDNKMENGGWPLWVKVHGGIPRVRDEESEIKMTKYCKKDVELTTAIFKVLRKFCTEVPNYNMFTDMEIKLCIRCGSTRIKQDGHHYNKTTVQKRYRCKDCNCPMRTDSRDIKLMDV